MGKHLVETGVEKALVAANTLEQLGRKAADSYNTFAEHAPIPLPRVPLGHECAEEEAAPTKPAQRAAAPRVTTEPTAKATAKAEPIPKVTAKPEPAARKTDKLAAVPAAAKPVEVEKAAKKVAGSKTARAATAAKKARAGKDEGATAAAPKKTRRRAIPGYNTLMKKYRKADLVTMADELGVAHQESDSMKDLAERIVAHAESLKA
jgi:hypothetical protein